MRSQFSLFWVFLAVAFAAIAIAGFVQPKSVWNNVNFYLWLAVLCYWGTAAAHESTFARGALAWTIIYVCATKLEMFTPFRDDPALLPHSWLLEWTPQPPGIWISIDVGYTDDDAESALNRSAIVNTSMLFGLIGGCLSVWRHRRWQRHSTPQESTTSSSDGAK